jgi:hypothetical protein
LEGSKVRRLYIERLQDNLFARRQGAGNARLTRGPLPEYGVDFVFFGDYIALIKLGDGHASLLHGDVPAAYHVLTPRGTPLMPIVQVPVLQN